MMAFAGLKQKFKHKESNVPKNIRQYYFNADYLLYDISAGGFQYDLISPMPPLVL
jgi:hypothetical protein